jgi:beta-lactamase class A
MTRLLAALAAAWSVAASQGAYPVDEGTSGLLRKQFERRLDMIASSIDGVMGYAIVDLTSNDRFERYAGATFPTASTIKIAVLYELFRQAGERRLSLDAPIRLDPAKAVGGTGVLFELSSVTMSLLDYATLMIVLSDNTATNMVIEAVGMDRVNARMQAIGAGDIRLRRRMMDLDAAAAGNENVASPAALARLLTAIYRNEGLSAASHEGLQSILRKAKSSAMLRALPPGVSVASKPGELGGVRVDAGIVELEWRPYVFVAMTSWLARDLDGERAIEDLSRASFEYFRRLDVSSEHGRAVR